MCLLVHMCKTKLTETKVKRIHTYFVQRCTLLLRKQGLFWSTDFSSCTYFVLLCSVRPFLNNLNILKVCCFWCNLPHPHKLTCKREWTKGFLFLFCCTHRLTSHPHSFTVFLRRYVNKEAAASPFQNWDKSNSVSYFAYNLCLSVLINTFYLLLCF